MSELSSAGQWTLFAALALLVAIVITLWVRYLPRLRMYRRKRNRLDGINVRYLELCRARKDIIYHFFWATDRGDTTEADMHEKRVLEIDRQLGDLRAQYKLAETNES
jgi:hypothetical protein